jgi:hypothetical protein
MRYALALSPMLVLACFGQAPQGSTTGDDTTSAGSSTAPTATSTMTAADTSTASTVDTSAQTSSTVDTSDDDGPTTGPDCEMGTVPTPPSPLGAWAGPGYLMAGDTPPPMCPAPLVTGPRALLGGSELGPTCPCSCAAEYFDICDFTIAAGSNCTNDLGPGGTFEDSTCANLAVAANAANVTAVSWACTPTPTPPQGEEIQLCPAQRDMEECFPLRQDMRGPCFWSLEGEQCPLELETVALARVTTCGECNPCDHTTYCDERVWTPYDAANCGGNAVTAVVTDNNCHLNFDALALSIQIAPGIDPPACDPTPLETADVTVCCIPE